MDNRGRQKILNTLTCVLVGLKGKRTTIELYNDSYVTGFIVDVDS